MHTHIPILPPPFPLSGVFDCSRVISSLLGKSPVSRLGELVLYSTFTWDRLYCPLSGNNMPTEAESRLLAPSLLIPDKKPAAVQFGFSPQGVCHVPLAACNTVAMPAVPGWTWFGLCSTSYVCRFVSVTKFGDFSAIIPWSALSLSLQGFRCYECCMFVDDAVGPRARLFFPSVFFSAVRSGQFILRFTDSFPVISSHLPRVPSNFLKVSFRPHNFHLKLFDNF